MKRILTFGFLLMGFTFTVTQGLLRELLVAFFGNELSIGLILGNWLILEAIGSGLLGRLTSRSIVGAIRGEGVDLTAISYGSLLMLGMCLISLKLLCERCQLWQNLQRLLQLAVPVQKMVAPGNM